MSDRHKFYVGVFRNGECLFRIGKSVETNFAAMEFVIELLKPSVTPVLTDGDYLAYDFEEVK